MLSHRPGIQSRHISICHRLEVCPSVPNGDLWVAHPWNLVLEKPQTTQLVVTIQSLWRQCHAHGISLRQFGCIDGAIRPVGIECQKHGLPPGLMTYSNICIQSCYKTLHHQCVDKVVWCLATTPLLVKNNVLLNNRSTKPKHYKTWSLCNKCEPRRNGKGQGSSGMGGCAIRPMSNSASKNGRCFLNFGGRS